MTIIRWGNAQLSVVIGSGSDRPVTIDSLDVAGHERTTPARQPLVELLVLGEGRTLNNTRFTSTGVGDRLRYVSHRTVVDDRHLAAVVEQPRAERFCKRRITLENEYLDGHPGA
jgi:alpha-galactosidase